MSNTIVLSKSDVIEIRLLSTVGLNGPEIADMFGISTRHVNNIITGNKWSSVPSAKAIAKFNNYLITADARVWSKTKGDFLSETTVKGQPAVRLRKTDAQGRRVETTINTQMLAKKTFGTSALV